MKVAVCIKRVPEMDLRFSIAPDKKSLEQSGLKYEMGDFDGYALEVALQLAEKQGGEVTVISLTECKCVSSSVPWNDFEPSRSGGKLNRVA